MKWEADPRRQGPRRPPREEGRKRGRIRDLNGAKRGGTLCLGDRVEELGNRSCFVKLYISNFIDVCHSLLLSIWVPVTERVVGAVLCI